MKRINVENAHPEYNAQKSVIRKTVQNLLNQEKQKKSVDIILIDDKCMIALNKKFRKRNRTTDVLAFGLQEGESLSIDDDNLGDVYISIDQAQRQAQDYQIEVLPGVGHVLIPAETGCIGEAIGNEYAPEYLEKLEAWLQHLSY